MASPVRPPAAYLGEGRVLVVTSAGVPVLAAADDLGVTPGLVLDGTVDAGYGRFLERELYGGAVAVDVGAGIGLGTLAMAMAVHRPGRVVAFEPEPASFALLRDSLAMNRERGLVAEVVLRPEAVGAGVGQAVLRTPSRQRARSTTNPTTALPAAASVDEVRVDVVTLDEALRAMAVIDLVRIDVGGAEDDVLAGMTGLLDAQRVRLLDVHLCDVRAGATWTRLVSRLDHLVQEHEPATFTLDERGHRVPLSLDAAVHCDAVAHLVLELRS
ncbi:MAG: FkbM family methyltransferase [Acidimicrobiales bacterium]